MLAPPTGSEPPRLFAPLVNPHHIYLRDLPRHLVPGLISVGALVDPQVFEHSQPYLTALLRQGGAQVLRRQRAVLLQAQPSHILCTPPPPPLYIPE